MPDTQPFGQLYATLYDSIYAEKNYAHECEVIESLFPELGKPAKILDLGCGTGQHAAHLCARGHQVTGIDQSADMLSLAQRRNLSSARFLPGNIINFALKERFDVVLIMFNVIGYLPGPVDLTDFFRNLHDHVEPGGRFIFDFWHGPAIEHDPPGSSLRSGIIDGVPWRREAEGQKQNGSVLVTCRLRLGETEATEQHSVRYYAAGELEAHLSAAGFEDIRFGNWRDPSAPPDIETWDALCWATAD
jgi:SAM-dependent methyltransferase